jgi:hypothetical protein
VLLADDTNTWKVLKPPKNTFGVNYLEKLFFSLSRSGQERKENIYF